MLNLKCPNTKCSRSLGHNERTNLRKIRIEEDSHLQNTEKIQQNYTRTFPKPKDSYAYKHTRKLQYRK